MGTYLQAHTQPPAQAQIQLQTQTHNLESLMYAQEEVYSSTHTAQHITWHCRNAKTTHTWHRHCSMRGLRCAHTYLWPSCYPESDLRKQGLRTSARARQSATKANLCACGQCEWVGMTERNMGVVGWTDSGRKRISGKDP